MKETRGREGVPQAQASHHLCTALDISSQPPSHRGHSSWHTSHHSPLALFSFERQRPSAFSLRWHSGVPQIHFYFLQKLSFVFFVFLNSLRSHGDDELAWSLRGGVIALLEEGAQHRPSSSLSKSTQSLLTIS
jgi:hypothetical protein